MSKKSLAEELIQMKKNFVFVGEAGCGKSEIAINWAFELARHQKKTIHFFDLDQTKPLFRSRSVKQLMGDQGIIFHHEEQFFDSPTIVGGVAVNLQDQNCHVVLDIGGNANGARSVGCFSQIINNGDSQVFYVINPYLPWSQDVRSIDATMSAILRSSRIKEFKILINPNVGYSTTAEELLEGIGKVREMLSDYIPVDAACVMDTIYDEVKGRTDIFLFPIHLYLTYPWINQ